MHPRSSFPKDKFCLKLAGDHDPPSEISFPALPTCFQLGSHSFRTHYQRRIISHSFLTYICRVSDLSPTQFRAFSAKQYLCLFDTDLKCRADYVKVWMGGILAHNNSIEYKESIDEFDANKKWVCVHCLQY